MRFLWILFSVTLVPMAVANEIDVASGVEYFQWNEFEDGGRKILEETGPRYFVDVTGTNRMEKYWSIDFGWRFYSGTVEYDGETQPPDVQPVVTDTDYNGFRAELGFTREVDSRVQDKTWLVRFAVGADRWRRSLLDTTLRDGTAVSGYVERYTSAYAKIGTTCLQKDSWSFGVGVKAPFYVSEEVGLNGGITLKPEGQLSLFADMEIPLNRVMSVAIEYDSFRFAKSDPESGLEQPKSTKDTVGLAWHYRF